MPTKPPTTTTQLLRTLRTRHTHTPPQARRQPTRTRPFHQTRTHSHPLTTLNTRLNTHLSGTRLEVLKFAFYISFPIGFMYYFGVNLSDDDTSPFRGAARDFWPDREMTHKVPFEREEIKEEMERLRERRLRVRERRLESERVEELGRRRLEEGPGGGVGGG